MLPHTVSSLSILRDRGDGGDSQQGTQAMPPSTSATLMVVLTTHQSEGLLSVVHGERHDVGETPASAQRILCVAAFTRGADNPVVVRGVIRQMRKKRIGLESWR